MTVLAGVFTALAILVRWPPQRLVVRWRLGLRGRPILRRPGRLPTAVALTCIGLLVARVSSFPLMISGSTGIGVAWFWWRLRRAARESALRRARSADVAEVVDALAAELGAGILPHQALEGISHDMALLDGAAAASRMGGDVAGALRTTSRQPGAEALADLAAAWEVSERSGAPMAQVLDRLGAGIRDERDIQREILAGIGPARATARLMAVLPLFGLGIGVSMGANPLEILLGTIPGALCLALGTALACAGVWWVDRIAVRAERV